MKKVLIVMVAILMICTTILLVGCEASAFKSLKNSIVENGKKNSEYKTYTVSTSGESVLDSTSLTYLEKQNKISLTKDDYYDGATTSMTIYIDSKLSGEYSWNFSYYRNGTSYLLGGTFYAGRATATDVQSAFVEDISKRSGKMTTSIASTALNLAKALGEEALEDFELYIVYQTDLKLSDFGYKA